MPSEKSNQIYQELKQRGFHEELCQAIAYKYMTTDYTAIRMLGYIYRMTDLTEELLVDEMIAIMEDRDRFRQKHEAEEAQQGINQVYNQGLGVEDDSDEE